MKGYQNSFPFCLGLTLKGFPFANDCIAGSNVLTGLSKTDGNMVTFRSTQNFGFPDSDAMFLSQVLPPIDMNTKEFIFKNDVNDPVHIIYSKLIEISEIPVQQFALKLEKFKGSSEIVLNLEEYTSIKEAFEKLERTFGIGHSITMQWTRPGTVLGDKVTVSKDKFTKAEMDKTFYADVVADIQYILK